MYTSAVVQLSGLVKADSNGIDSIYYVVSNNCGYDTSWKKLTITPAPNAGVITGPIQLCNGSKITLSDAISGGNWLRTNTNAVVESGGVIIGNHPGKDTILYRVTNSCGSDTVKKIVTVNPNPTIPAITTKSPATLCMGTNYMNFGADSMPATGVEYSWVANNAQVYATGTTRQYCLVNFPDSGTATVQLNMLVPATGCYDSVFTNVTVDGSNDAPATQVIYSSPMFFCLDESAKSYQWGYDDFQTKDSSLIPGQINQYYYNPSPDYTHKNYWVIISSGSCIQKVYYNAPTGIVNNLAGNDVIMELFPNPAENEFNVTLTGINAGDEISLHLLDISGKTIKSLNNIGSKATVNISDLPSGYYFVEMFRNGYRSTTKSLIKN